MDMVGESGNLFILSLDSPSPREGEVCFPLRAKVWLLKELAATVERAHVVDALAASPLPSEQTDEGTEYKEDYLISRMEARETQQKTARATARPMRSARSA